MVSFTPRTVYPQGKNPRYPLDKTRWVHLFRGLPKLIFLMDNILKSIDSNIKIIILIITVIIIIKLP
jgi:hypothetical protein